MLNSHQTPELQSILDRVSALQIADEQNVKLTGNQDIDGNKHFMNSVYCICSDVDKTTNPDQQTFKTFEFLDKNRARMGIVEQSVLPNGNMLLYLNMLNQNGNYSPRFFGLAYDKDKNIWKSVAPPSAELGSIVTTEAINTSQTGSCKLGNGIILNWGTTSVNAKSNVWINFNHPFSGDETYGFAIIGGYASVSNDGQNAFRLNGHQKTGTLLYFNGTATNPAKWIAIGY